MTLDTYSVPSLFLFYGQGCRPTDFPVTCREESSHLLTYFYHLTGTIPIPTPPLSQAGFSTFAPSMSRDFILPKPPPRPCITLATGMRVLPFQLNRPARDISADRVRDIFASIGTGGLSSSERNAPRTQALEHIRTLAWRYY